MPLKLALLAVLIASPAIAGVGDTDWSITPGEWTIPYEVRRSPFMDQCAKADICTSFMAPVIHSMPTCIRYLEPKVFHDGREIPGHVTEVGTPGEPGWQWTFRTDEIFTGPFIWKVKTIDVCPKVG
jgi:hypothetical protein